MRDPAPLILTLTLDASSQSSLDALRARHFPPERLFVGAHVTLFHALPGDLALDVIVDAVAGCEPFPVAVTGLRSLGRGVALRLESDRLRRLRDQLRQHWLDQLTPQDRQPWQPHVTIQNKVEPGVARALHDALAASFTPWQATAMGLDLWIYRHGRWEAAETFPFSHSGLMP